MKLFYRRILPALLCLALLCGGLTACSRGGSDQGESGSGSSNSNTGNKKQITLTVWGAQEDQQMLKEMCDAYAKENSGAATRPTSSISAYWARATPPTRS